MFICGLGRGKRGGEENTQKGRQNEAGDTISFKGHGGNGANSRRIQMNAAKEIIKNMKDASSFTEKRLKKNRSENMINSIKNMHFLSITQVGTLDEM